MRIESFSFGTITVDGRKYSNDILLLPPLIVSQWWREEGHRLDKVDLLEVLKYRPDILVVGTGVTGMMIVPDSTVREVESTGMRVEIYTTDKACERFNSLMVKGEKAAGAFHLSC